MRCRVICGAGARTRCWPPSSWCRSGKSAGQRLLHRLTEGLPGIVERALELADDALGVGTVSQALASARHESQYTRLFRS